MTGIEVQPGADGDNAPHVLVVDDDQRLRDLLRRYLSENGFRVTTAGDAAEARQPVGVRRRHGSREQQRRARRAHQNMTEG